MGVAPCYHFIVLWETCCFARRCGVALVLDWRRKERDRSMNCDVTEERNREGTRYLGHVHFLTPIHWFFIILHNVRCSIA